MTKGKKITFIKKLNSFKSYNKIYNWKNLQQMSFTVVEIQSAKICIKFLLIMSTSKLIKKILIILIETLIIFFCF